MNTDLSIVIAAEFALAEKTAELLEQSDLPVGNMAAAKIYPFGEERGIRFNNKAVAQFAIEEIEWSEVHYLFFAGGSEHAEHLARAADAGCVVIDMKGVCAGLSDVPLVVPTVNEFQLAELRQRNIVSLPDVQITQSALAVAPLVEENMSQILVTSLLPASYMSGEHVEQLAGQTAQLLNGIPLDDEQQRLAFDVFPAQTQNLPAQLQKIFPQLESVVFHQVQTPVFYGMAQHVTALSGYGLDAQNTLHAWRDNPLIRYEQKTITPVTNGEAESNEDTVHLHISALTQLENGVSFWSVSDEQRFALALMSVKLAESIYRRGD